MSAVYEKVELGGRVAGTAEMRLVVAALICAMVVPATAKGEDRPTYTQLLAESNKCDPRQVIDERYDTRIICGNGPLTYYVAKPTNPAHPGIIKTHRVGAEIKEEGFNSSTSRAQACFRDWLADVKFNERQRELEAQPRQPGQEMLRLERGDWALTCMKHPN